MREFVLLVSFLIGSNAWGLSHNPQRCQQLETEARQILVKLNQMFRMDVTVTFIETVTFFGRTHPARLMDANAGQKDAGGRETLEFPKPCILVEALPTNELWAMMVAHEFSHKILDKHLEACSSVSDRTHSQEITGDSTQLYNVNHLNVYLMSLKILKHFALNGKKASEDFEKWSNWQSAQLDLESAKAIKGISKFLKSKWVTTSFNSGADFSTGEYFDVDGLAILDQFLKTNYPKSTLVKDVKNKTFREIGACLMFKSEDVLSTLNSWKKSIGL